MDFPSDFHRQRNPFRLSLDLRANPVELLADDHKSCGCHRQVEARHYEIGYLEALKHIHTLLEAIKAALYAAHSARDGGLQLLQALLSILCVTRDHQVSDNLAAFSRSRGVPNNAALERVSAIDQVGQDLRRLW